MLTPAELKQLHPLKRLIPYFLPSPAAVMVGQGQEEEEQEEEEQEEDEEGSDWQGSAEGYDHSLRHQVNR